MKLVLQRAALLVGSLLLALAVAEAALSVYHAASGGSKGGGRLEVVEEVGSPYIFTTNPAFTANDYGIYRSAPVALVPEPGVVRVLSYGDSIAQGFGLSERETYTHLLEERLGASGRRFEILNMSRGHSPTIAAFHIRRDVPRFAPDAVILEIELINDVSDEAHVKVRGEDEHGLPLEIDRYRYILGWDGELLAPITVSGSFLERTKVYAQVTRALGRLLSSFSDNPVFAEDSKTTYYSFTSDRWYLTQARLDAGFERLFESLGGIQRFLAGEGVELLLVIVPSQYAFGDPRYEDGALDLIGRAEARAQELGIPTLSLHAAMSRAGGADLFMDFCHPTAEGNRVIADALFERFVGEALVR